MTSSSPPAPVPTVPITWYLLSLPKWTNLGRRSRMFISVHVLQMLMSMTNWDDFLGYWSRGNIEGWRVGGMEGTGRANTDE